MIILPENLLALFIPTDVLFGKLLVVYYKVYHNYPSKGWSEQGSRFWKFIF